VIPRVGVAVLVGVLVSVGVSVWVLVGVTVSVNVLVRVKVGVRVSSASPAAKVRVDPSLVGVPVGVSTTSVTAGRSNHPLTLA
jgi:hypothetical protein